MSITRYNDAYARSGQPSSFHIEKRPLYGTGRRYSLHLVNSKRSRYDKDFLRLSQCVYGHFLLFPMRRSCAILYLFYLSFPPETIRRDNLFYDAIFHLLISYSEQSYLIRNNRLYNTIYRYLARLVSDAM